MAAEISAKVHEAFVRIAGQTNDDEEPRMHAPGVEGVQVFLQSITGNVSVADVRRWYDSKGWFEMQSLSWSHVEALLACFDADTKRMVDGATDVESQSEAEREAHEVTILIDKLRERQEADDFPIVRPCDLQNPEGQEAASMTLALIEKIETVKNDSYVAEMRRKALEAEFKKEGEWPEQLSEPEKFK